MQEWEPQSMTPQVQAPTHAKLLSLFWGASSCLGILKRLHVLLTKFPPTYTSHLLLHQFLPWTESALVLAGAILLWNMRPLAAKLFLANLAITVTGTIYLTFVSPDSQMVLLKQKSYFPWILVIGIGYSALCAGYVWWVTSRPATAKAEPSSRNSSQAPTAAKFISIMYGLAASIRLLSLFHVLPSSFGLRINYTEHPMTYHFATLASAAIMLPAAVYLWKMRSIAAKLFLANLLLVTVLTIYLTCISPDTQMLSDFPVLTLLRFVIAIAACAYVWWVTSPRKPVLLS
jgi:hypothetical protein